MKPTYTFEEACQYLNIGATSLNALLLAGELPGAKISQCWVLRECDLGEYLAEQVRIQTAMRRDARINTGCVAKIKPAASAARGVNRPKPVLPKAA